MKRIISAHFPASLIVFSLLVTFISSCTDKNYKMITRVDSNGSGFREIYASGDSAFLVGDQSHNPFLFTIDSTWSMTQLIPTDSEKSVASQDHFNVRIRKNFKSINDLSNTLQAENRFRTFAVPKESLTKRFRWFYTYHTFTGSYTNISNKIPVNVNQYMNREEQKLWFQGDLSPYKGLNGIELKDLLDNIEKKYLMWWMRCVYEESFHVIQQANEVLGSSSKFHELNSIKDTLFAINSKKLDYSDDIQPADVCKMLDNYYQTDHFSKLFKENEQNISKSVELKIKPLEDLLRFSIDYQLIMPGTVLHTNTERCNQDTLIWKVDAFRLVADNYLLIAESRTPNTWAFIVTFLISLVAIYCFLKLIRMKRGH